MLLIEPCTLSFLRSSNILVRDHQKRSFRWNHKRYSAAGCEWTSGNHRHPPYLITMLLQVKSIHGRAKTLPIVSVEDAVSLTNLANALELVPGILQKTASQKISIERQSEHTTHIIQGELIYIKFVMKVEIARKVNPFCTDHRFCEQKLLWSCSHVTRC